MTKMGMKREKPQFRYYLKRKKGISKMSNRAKDELTIWMVIKHDRMMALLRKFGFIPCEYCKESVNTNSELYCPEAHHNNHDRRDNSFQNARILHRVCNQLIEDKNIKDVPSLLDDSKV